MNLIEKVKAHSNKEGLISSPVKGQWFSIKFTPDLFAADSISIGVGFINSEGLIRSQLASDLSRLKCFYDESVNIADIEFLVEILEDALLGLHKEELNSGIFGPSISFSPPSFAQGRSETEILDSLFASAVPLARPKKVESRKSRTSFETESTICRKVGDSLGNRYKKIAPKFNAKGFNFKVDDRGHSIKMHFREEGRASGYVASALFADMIKAEVHVRRGVDALRTLRHHVDKERCGLFVVRPGEHHGLNAKFLNQFDDLMDDLNWRLREDDIDIRDADSPDLMADQIAEWYQAA